jgi:YtcA family
MIRARRIFATICVIPAMTGCSKAPAIDVMGSLFPAWLLCIVLGTLLTAGTHWLLTRQRFNLLFPFVTYPCLAAAYTFTIWLIFF